jgi:hypothetical protein
LLHAPSLLFLQGLGRSDFPQISEASSLYIFKQRDESGKANGWRASRELLRRRELVPEHERAKALAAQWGIDPDFRAPANLPISIDDLRNEKDFDHD